MLDIKSTNKGLLIPRINLVSETDVSTIPSPNTSLLIYNTNASMPDGMGFYFYNGNKWSKLSTINNITNFSWGLNGNNGDDTNFIGTTNNKPLVFKTNNLLSGKIDAVLNNVFLGRGAGKSVTTGTNNSFFGNQAGFSTTTGYTNTAIGSSALYSGAGTIANVAIGFNSQHSTTLGYYNTAIGNSSLYTNTTGNNNVANGYEALYSNTSGYSNTATGYFAMHNNTIGDNNVAYGIWALKSSTTARFNTAIGSQALLDNLTGAYNVAVGFNSSSANSDGSYNTAIGMEANFQNNHGNYNVANGYQALYNNDSSYDVAVGAYAMKGNTTGKNNIAIGYNALQYNTTGNNNTSLGYDAGPPSFVPSLVNTTCIGSLSNVLTSNTMAFGDGDVVHWGFGLNSVLVTAALQVGRTSANGNGAYLTLGGTWTNASSRIKKEDFSNIDGTELLLKIQELPIQKWKYKGTDEYHIGPVAEDFYKLFGLGADDKGISTVDPSGISLAAIKELIRQNRELKRELTELKNEINLLASIPKK